MDIQFALVMLILATTIGVAGVTLWKKTRQSDNECATNCGCSGGGKPSHAKAEGRRP